MTLPRISFIQGLSRAERVNTRSSLVIFGLCLVAGHAGGLGIAPLAAIAGFIGLITYILQNKSFPLKPPLWMIALFVFLIWAAITTAWSPYPPKGLSNPIKLLLGVSLFIAAIPAFKRSAYAAPKSAIAVTIWLSAIATVFICIDTVTGYQLSFFFDPLNEGEDPISRLGDAEMNVGHGLTFLNLIFPTVLTLALWTQRKGHWFCLALIALLVIAAFAGKLMVSILTIAFSGLIMALAYKYGLHIIRGLTVLAMSLIGFAPLWGGLLGLLPQSARDSLPFSWEHRVVAWSFVAEKTKEAPIFGHGFDTARTIQDTFSARGFDDIAVVSLHPHNAGLHIWLETGAVGALLAVITLWVLGQMAEAFARGGRARSLAASGFMSAAIIISSVSYGVWQDWWWASLCIAIGILHWVPKTQSTQTGPH